MGELSGTWKVRRESGLLPPVGITKRIGDRRGVTRVLRLPVAPFRVEGHTLRYLGLPVRDELAPREDGTWVGRGLLFGLEFCRFRLVPA